MKVALLPGGFKPPHLGYYNMAKYLADFADNVIVRIGSKERESIGPKLALEIFNYYKAFDPNQEIAKKLTISLAQSASPVKDVYDFIEQIAPEGSTVILGIGEKDAKDGRYNAIPKFAEPRNIKADIELVPPQAGGISGTRMREIIKNNNKEEFFKFIPEFLPKEIKEEIWIKLVDTTMPSEIDEMMGGTMNKEEMAKHMANMKKLRKFFSKQGDQMTEIPPKLTKGLRRKLYEGRYDQETLMQSRFIVNIFKANFGEFTEESTEGNIGGIEYELDYIFEPNIKEVGPLPFIIDGEADYDTLQIKIKYNPDRFPEAYTELIPEIKDTIRHELEHIAQFNFSKGVNPNSQKLSKYTWFQYFTFDHEIPAFVQGLYKRAKTKRISFTEAVNEFLINYLDVLTDEEEIKIKQIWTDYARKNLPAAQIDEKLTIGNKIVKTIHTNNSNNPEDHEIEFEDGTREPYLNHLGEGDTYEKMAAKGKKAGNLKQGTVRKRLNIPKGEKIPLSLINKELTRLKKIEKRSAKNQKYYKALTLAKTLKTTTHKENIDPKAQKKHKGKAAPYGSAYEPVDENFPPYKANQVQQTRYRASDTFTNDPKKAKKLGYLQEKDPKVGTGKKPKGSGRRLYTDENPKDTVSIKFSTRQDIVDTLSKKSFKAKSHARQSQIINLIHQRVRAAYGRAKDPAVKKRLKTALDYITKRKEASKKKTQRMKKEGLFSQEWWLNIITEELLHEGGAAGHMAHPFDLPNVKTGKDLIKSFEQAADSLKKSPGSVKIDGVNASIRLINLDGKRIFAMDRGSKKALDLRGVTKADLEDRFGAGHGMIKAGGDVLDIFNDALPTIQEELNALGLLDDPNIMFNMEYVSGKSNVQDYGKNFLAIHGLLKVETKEVQGARKMLTKRITSEKLYDKADLEELLKKLEPFAKKRGFEIYGSVPTKFTKEPDFKAALNTRYTIDTAEGDQTKTLAQWLGSVTNIPKTDRLKMNIEETDSIKDVGALSKQVYFAVFGGENVDSLFSNEQEVQKAIQGATTYLATEKLGDAILDVLDSPMGSVNDHEGVVIRDDKISPKPFKITGKFITGGVSSNFQKK